MQKMMHIGITIQKPGTPWRFGCTYRDPKRRVVSTAITIPNDFTAYFNFHTKLNGRKVLTTLPVILEMIVRLGSRRSANPHECTPTNVGFALSQLFKFGSAYPQGRWNIYVSLVSKKDPISPTP